MLSVFRGPESYLFCVPFRLRLFFYPLCFYIAIWLVRRYTLSLNLIYFSVSFICSSGFNALIYGVESFVFRGNSIFSYGCSPLNLRGHSSLPSIFFFSLLGFKSFVCYFLVWAGYLFCLILYLLFMLFCAAFSMNSPVFYLVLTPLLCSSCS